MGDQEIAPPQKAGQGFPGDGKHVVPLQAAPDGLELQDALQRGIAGIIGAIDRPDAGADHHVGDHAVPGERMQHADLDRAKTAASRQHEGGPAAHGVVG
jgi:hypothetical protein